ncbi:MAG: 4Fe-4S binding protein [Candidatus Schekmanbacteria bacterium]|nr:4Fe-4S binding protein [Candidatus Schekmanbacteria bacterium]
MLQITRRTVQALVIIFLAVVLSLNLYEGAKVKRDGDWEIKKSAILLHIDKYLGQREDRSTITNFFNGNIWSLKVKGFAISDPLAVLSYFIKSKKANIVFFLSLLIPVFFTVLLGRFFCGWLCPMHLLLEIADKFKMFLSRIGLPTYDIGVPLITRHIILGGGVLLGIFAGIEYFQFIYPPRLFSMVIHDILFGSVLTYGVWFIVAITAFEFLFSRRLWCRNICPGGTLYSYFGNKALLNVEPVRDGCNNCLDCRKVCPYALSPDNGNLDGTCDRCGLCISACDKKILDYKLNRAGSKSEQTV